MEHRHSRELNRVMPVDGTVEIQKALTGVGLRVQGPALARLAGYTALLHQWSERVRLVSRADRDRLVDRHIVDSLVGLRVLPEDIHTVFDIGTGGGLPGIPIKIARPQIRLVLVESARMKVLFLRHAVASLGLTDVEVIHKRIEQVPPDFRRSADCVLARALADLDRLWALASPLLADAGVLIAWKGEGEAGAAAELDGVCVEEHVFPSRNASGSRALVTLCRR